MRQSFSIFVVLGIALTVLQPLPIQSQTPCWDVMWKLSSYPTATYSWMYQVYPGLAYDSARNKLYVVSTKTIQGVITPDIFILDPASGDTIGKFKIDRSIISTGFSNGVYCLYKIRVAEDGSIYACNMVSPNGAQQGQFKVFKWSSPTANAIQVYPSTLNGSDSLDTNRWGDAFAVIGEGDSTTIFVSGGSINAFNPQFVALQATDSTATKFRRVRKMISSLNGIASHGLAPTGVSKLKPVWVNSIVRVTSLQTQAQTPVSVDDVPTNVDRLSSGGVRYFEVPALNRKMIVTCDGENDDTGDSTRGRVIDVSVPNQFFLECEATPPVGDQELISTSGIKNFVQDIDWKLVGNRLTLFLLMSANGIAAMSMTRDLYPVELQSFTAHYASGRVTLEWGVASETNNHGFSVQRSFDGGKTYSEIGFVLGRGTTSTPHRYFFDDYLDDSFSLPHAVLYRLRQIDFDGTTSYSPVVEVVVHRSTSRLGLGQNYPNPVRGTSSAAYTMISYQVDAPAYVSLVLYDALGREVRQLILQEKSAGAHTVMLNANGLPSGLYIYKLTALGQTTSRALVIQ